MTGTVSAPAPDATEPDAAPPRERAVWWLALVWGFFLPIEYVSDVPDLVLHVLHYGPVPLLVLFAPTDLGPTTRRRILTLAGLLAVFGLFRAGMGQWNDDPGGRYVGVVTLVSVAACLPIALRTVLHKPILVGYLAGATASAIVCVMQAMSIPTLRDGNENGKRFPGLSTYTMLLTWQLVFAILIAVFLLVRLDRRRPAWWAAAATIPICAVAMVVNGAQGGFLGGIAALIAVVAWSRRRFQPEVHGPTIATIAIWAAVIAVLVSFFIVAAGVSIPTIDGFLGEGDYVNERARIDVARTGWQEMAANPLRGIGRTQFIDTHVIAPHFLPLEAGAAAGVVAFALATAILLFTYRQLLRRPAPGSYALLGMALLAAQCSNTLTEASGPFIGVSHLILLLISIVAAQVGDAPDAPGISLPSPTLAERLVRRRSTTTAAPTTPPR